MDKSESISPQTTATDMAFVGDIVAHWSERAPDRVALVEGKRSWTWTELASAIETTSTWLAESQIRPGDRVMLVCENCGAAVAIIFALMKLGAWPIVVNARFSEREIDEIRDHSGTRRMIFTTAVSLKAEAHADRLGSVSVDLGSLGSVAISPLNESALAEPVEPDADKRVAVLIYTSGTTGQPKGVMLTHRNLTFVARATAHARGLAADDRVYAVLPISHILGLTGVLLGSLLSGAQVHLVSRFDPAMALNALARDSISVMIGTPSMYALLVEYASRKGLTPISGPALRLISSAGAPLDAATKATTEQVFARVLHNGYGITECSPSITLTSLETPRSDCSIGCLLPGIEARLVDPTGMQGVANEVGELQVRGPGVMKGYYLAPAATAAAIEPDGWFKTGDLARVEDGNYFIMGRVKEMIIRFGFNVYPAEVEGVLNAHVAVARSAVIGHEADGGEEVVAFIQPTAGSAVTADEIADYARGKLAAYKHPSRIILMPQLPMTPTGKILKNELSALC